MRHPTAIDTKRTEQAQRRRPPQKASLLESVGGDQLSLITRDAVIRTEGVIGLLVASNPPRKQLDVLCAYGTAASNDRASPTARLSGFARRVLECGRTLCEPTAARRSPRLSADSGAQGAYAIGAPVWTPGGGSGALCVQFPDAPPDPRTTLWVVESYARLASLCLHDAAALDGLLAAGRFDALTGCLNHTAIRAELEREIARSDRHRRALSCCFVDLDRFKLVNDSYGHPEGSRVLASVATILRDGVRSADTVGRYGGDEFIVVLPDTSSDSARPLAERLRSLIGAAKLIGGREPLDASIGVAQWRAGATAAELVSAADDALRAAKLAGGGIVVTEGDVAAGAGRGVVKVAR
jgi:diguanylate cyclase (GGDEF)-like protein